MFVIQLNEGQLLGFGQIEMRAVHAGVFNKVAKPAPSVNDWGQLKATREALTRQELADASENPSTDMHYYIGWPGRVLCGKPVKMVESTTRPSEVTCIACRAREFPTPASAS